MLKRNGWLALAALAGISLWQSLPPQTRLDPTVQSDQSELVPVLDDPGSSYYPGQAPGELAAQGSEALGMSHYAEAIQLLTQAAATDPVNTQIWIDIAYAYLALGNCDCAISRLNYVLQLDPHHAQAYWLRAQAYQMRGLEGDADRALADARQALRLAPNNLQAYDLLLSLERSNPWPGSSYSLEDFEYYLDHQAGGQTYSTPVQSRLQTGSQAFAHQLSHFNHTIARHPEVAQGYLQRALYLWQASQVDPFQPTSEAASAVTALLSSVLQDLNQAIALDPQLASAYELRSYLYLRTRELELALADLEMLGSLGFANSAWHQQMGRVLFEMGSSHWQQALDDVEYAIEIAEDAYDLAQAYLMRARILTGVGSWDRALMDYTRALEIQPLAEAHYYRGILTLQAGLSPIGALADLERALSLWQTTASGTWEQVMDAIQVRDALRGS